MYTIRTSEEIMFIAKCTYRLVLTDKPHCDGLDGSGYSCESPFNITTGPKTTSFSHMPPNILACKSVIFPALVNEVYDPPTSSELCIAHDVSSCRRSSFLDGKSNDVVVQSSIEHKEVKWESEELWRTDT